MDTRFKYVDATKPKPRRMYVYMYGSGMWVVCMQLLSIGTPLFNW